MKLVKASMEHKELIIDMLKEWSAYNNAHPGVNTSPAAIFKNDWQDFEFYCDHIDYHEPKEGKVPSSTFFCLDEKRHIMVGAINIRHYLNDYLLKFGGHIGDGIRPTERKKGYATKMIKLGLEECKKLGLDRVLLVCDKDNIGSAKSIINNGGILENEILDGAKIVQRYWIDLR